MKKNMLAVLSLLCIGNFMQASLLPAAKEKVITIQKGMGLSKNHSYTLHASKGNTQLKSMPVVFKKPMILPTATNNITIIDNKTKAQFTQFNVPFNQTVYLTGELNLKPAVL